MVKALHLVVDLSPKLYNKILLGYNSHNMNHNYEGYFMKKFFAIAVLGCALVSGGLNAGNNFSTDCSECWKDCTDEHRHCRALLDAVRHGEVADVAGKLFPRWDGDFKYRDVPGTRVKYAEYLADIRREIPTENLECLFKQGPWIRGLYRNRLVKLGDVGGVQHYFSCVKGLNGKVKALRVAAYYGQLGVLQVLLPDVLRQEDKQLITADNSTFYIPVGDGQNANAYTIAKRRGYEFCTAFLRDKYEKATGLRVQPVPVESWSLLGSEATDTAS